MSKHTPGPWRLDGLALVTTAHRDICKVYPHDEGRANARLIRAAPQMLEALKAVQALTVDFSPETEQYVDVNELARLAGVVGRAVAAASADALEMDWDEFESVHEAL